MIKPRRFIHDFDLVACVETEHDDFYNTPKKELLKAMQNRLASLKDDEIFEAFGHINTCEVSDG